MTTARYREYRLIIDEILAAENAFRGQGLPGMLSAEEMEEIRDLLENVLIRLSTKS